MKKKLYLLISLSILLASCGKINDIAYVYGYGDYREYPVVNEEGRIVYVHECESDYVITDRSGGRCSDYDLAKKESENNEK